MSDPKIKWYYVLKHSCDNSEYQGDCADIWYSEKLYLNGVWHGPISSADGAEDARDLVRELLPIDAETEKAYGANMKSICVEVEAWNKPERPTKITARRCASPCTAQLCPMEYCDVPVDAKITLELCDYGVMKVTIYEEVGFPAL